MRQITVKYDGRCAACGAGLDTGEQAMYEKSMGVFCVGCEPKNTEDIRSYRQEKADRKADRYDDWAEKREKKAREQLNSYPSIRHDWAFVTQPGRIPFRDRMNRSDDRAMESLAVAEGMRNKAENLRHVRVAGDAERKRQAKREALDEIIGKGSGVCDAVFGMGIVVSVHKKSYRIKFSDTLTCARDKSFVRPA